MLNYIAEYFLLPSFTYACNSIITYLLIIFFKNIKKGIISTLPMTISKLSINFRGSGRFIPVIPVLIPAVPKAEEISNIESIKLYPYNVNISELINMDNIPRPIIRNAIITSFSKRALSPIFNGVIAFAGSDNFLVTQGIDFRVIMNLIIFIPPDVENELPPTIINNTITLFRVVEVVPISMN